MGIIKTGKKTVKTPALAAIPHSNNPRSHLNQSQNQNTNPLIHTHKRGLKMGEKRVYKSKTSKIITLLLITALILPIGIPLIMTTMQAQNQLENMKNQAIITQLATTTESRTSISPITKSTLNQIVVDGDPSDWIGVSPLVSDTLETDNWLDVKALYVTHDASNLYLRIDSANAIPKSGYHAFEGWLNFDVDNGKNSYELYYQWGGGGTYKNIFLIKNSLIDSSWSYVENPSFLQIAANSNILEIGVGLSDIGNPNQINITLIAGHSYFSYTIGEVTKSIEVDGYYSDWTGVNVAMTDEQGETNPSYSDLTDIFVADDGNKLYVRMDTASKPKISISGTTGELLQNFYVLFDTDRNKNTGLSGADYQLVCCSGEGDLFKWNGDIGNWEEVSANVSAALNDVCESNILLSDLGIVAGETIDISTVIMAQLDDYVPDSGHVTHKVPCLRFGGYEVNKFDGSVHGELNLTAVWEPASCSVTFEVMGPNGATIRSETQPVSLPADTETTVSFDWTSGDLPLGDYHARFRVRNVDNSLIFDSGWFFAFSMEHGVYTYSFGSIGPNSTKTWSQPRTLDRHQFAVFDFTLPSDVDWIDITLEGGWKSGFLVTVGNATLSSFRDVYLSPFTSDTWRIYNIPSGSYSISIVSESSSSLSKLEISTSSYLVEDITVGDLRDSGGLRHQFSGLCGADKTYYLDVVYVTALEEDVSVSISNPSIGVSWSGTLKTSPFSSSRTATFQIELEFPSQPHTSTVSVDASLLASSVNDGKEMPFVSVEQDYDIDLEYEVTTYWRVPSFLRFWEEHTETAVDVSQLEALDVSNIRIVDVNVGSDGRIDNITVSFHIENKYESSFLWWKYYTHYDLYVYPVRVGDTVTEKFVTGMIAGEQEDIEIQGIPVTYHGDQPRVLLRIIFQKSLFLNVLGWGLEKGVGNFIPVGSLIAPLAFKCADALLDHVQFQMTAGDVEDILDEIYGIAYKQVLKNYYNTEDPTGLMADLDPVGLLMDLTEKDPGNGWKIVGAIIDRILSVAQDHPEVLEGIIESAYETLMGETIDIAAGTISEVAKQALSALKLIDAALDAIYKLSAPDREIKSIMMDFSGPYTGTPSYPSFSDPIIRISFTGQTSESLSNYVRLYDVLRMRVETTRTGTDQGTVTITFTPFENSTGRLISILSDDLIRCGILSMFGVSVEFSDLSQEGQNLIISGSGELMPGTYNSLIMEIDENTVQGFVEQPFMAQEVEGWFTVNQTVLYTYGENMSYTLELELPADAKNIRVLTPGYTIDGNTITWNTQVDRIIVQYKLSEENPPEPSPPQEALSLFMLLFLYPTGTPIYYIALIGVVAVTAIGGIAVYLRKRRRIGSHPTSRM